MDQQLKPTKTLPDHYNLDASLDLSKNMRALLVLNLVGLILFFFFGWVFWRLFAWLRPDFNQRNFVVGSFSGWVLFLLASVLVIVFHEIIHGVFFWIFLRDRPTFGFRGAYAFAAAPDWFIPRRQFAVIGLAPLLVITTVGLLALPLTPSNLLPASLFALTINAAGAVGDLFVVGWLFTKPPSVLVNDEGDRFSMFLPSGE